MKLHGSVPIGIVLFILATVSANGLSQATKTPQAAGPTDPVPIVHMKFEDDPFAVPLPSQVVIGLPSCGFNGGILAQFSAKPDYETKGMYSIIPGKGVHMLAIPDPTDNLFKRHFLEESSNDSGAYILTFMIRASGENGDRDAKDPASYEILSFDEQGFKDAIHPQVKFRPMRIGVFPDGKFLITGYDYGNQTPRVAILDSGGAYLTSVNLENALPTNNELQSSLPARYKMMPESERAAGAFNFYQMWPTPSGMALMKQGTTKIILITSGGGVRTVTPKLPEGYTVTSFVQSDKRWLLRAKGPDTEGQAGKFDIYEIRGDDGSLIRKLDTSPAPSVGFACEHDGEFKLFHWVDEKPHLEIAKPQ
jgi:hypothetical protein